MRKHHHHHHSRNRKRDAWRTIFGFGSILLILVVGFYTIKRWENRAFHVNAPTSEDSELLGSRTITIDGTTYRQRRNLKTYLFLGIDAEGPAKAVKGYYGGGQADVQMVMVVDHDQKTWQLLQLNRDTIAEVPILGIQGDVVGKKQEQIALSHSYGNGMEQSCRNSVRTITELLWGQKIDGYLSLHMDGVSVINDAIGGVPVKITSDFSKVDDTLPLGEIVNLEGSQALTFVRSRQGVDDETNVSRMERQRQYLDALGKKLTSLDQESILIAYDSAYEYLVTDMGSQLFLDLVTDMGRYEELKLLTIDGEAVIEEGHWAYHLDQQSLQDTILQMFYSIEP